jgi:hypothetical protein
MTDRPNFFIGIDLGQTNDYTALSVIEQTKPKGREASYAVTHLDRWRGITYPDGIDRTSKVLASIDRMRTIDEFTGEALKPTIATVVDQTGVGRPVVDLLRAEKMPGRLVAVTITGGDTVSKEGDDYRVPKRDLAGVVAVLLQTERLKIASGMELADVLVRELTSFRVKVSASGHDSYGNGTEWRDAEHDDLVLAVALALWLAEHGSKGRHFAMVALGIAKDGRSRNRW